MRATTEIDIFVSNTGNRLWMVNMVMNNLVPLGPSFDKWDFCSGDWFELKKTVL